MIRFNTGRGYTEAGQRIAAKRTEDGGILFVDYDRMIDGLFPAADVRKYAIELQAWSILHAYDHLADVWSNGRTVKYRLSGEIEELRAFARGADVVKAGR